MELVEGATLRDYLHDQGRIPPERAIPLIIPVASALAAAHKIGIIHRDIKPENILVSKEGRIKIADFGLARGALLGSTMTAESSVILGSVSYLSPEQVQRGVADARSDVYSLGIVLFELLTGDKPYQGEDPVQIAIRHVNDRVPAPSTLNSTITPDIDALVLRATDINPDKRPADGAALLEELRALSEKLDPRKRQLSLELDLPPLPIKQPVRERQKISRSKAKKSDDSTVAIEKSESEKENSMAKAKRATQSLKAVSPRVKRNRKIAALMALLLLFGSWYIWAGPGSKVVVPSLAGFTIKDARSELSNFGLALDVGDEEFSEDVSEGRIIKSSPAGGGRIDDGGIVTVVVSKGRERFLVPDLTGLKPDVAQELIEDNKLVIGEIIEEFSSDYRKGRILRTSPAKGERVKRDTTLTLFISKGIEQISLSDYQGKSGEQALNELVEAGFEVETEYIFSEDLPAGAVISQSPGSGEADKGSTITLIVSKGTEFVFIPNVFALNEEKAVAALEDLELKVVVKKVGNKKTKVVTNIAPKVGSKVKRGSTVTITVG
jgi:serine/threonine-protein kinase